MGLAGIRVPSRYGGESGELRLRHDLMGWPRTVDHSTKAYKLVERGFELIPGVRKVFPTTRAWKVALGLHNMVLWAQGLVPLDIHKPSKLNSDLCVPPNFMLLSSEELQEVVDRAADLHVGNVVSTGRMSLEEFDIAWHAGIEKASGYFRNDRLSYRTPQCLSQSIY